MTLLFHSLRGQSTMNLDQMEKQLLKEYNMDSLDEILEYQNKQIEAKNAT